MQGHPTEPSQRSAGSAGSIVHSGTGSALSPVGGPEDTATGVVRFAVILGGILTLSLLALELQRLWLERPAGGPSGNAPLAPMLTMVFACLGVAGMANRQRRPALVLTAASALLVLHTLLAAWFGAQMLAGPLQVSARPSWTGVVLLLFSLLVAAPPLLHYALLTFSSLVAPFVLAVLIVTGQAGGPHAPPQLARRMIVANSSTWICAIVSVAIVIHRERDRRRMQAMAKQLATARGELQELGSYQLERRLGPGRLGEVWQATHRTLARPAAIKLVGADLLRQAAGSPEQLERTLARFQQEAKLAARLTSAHTVQVFDYGRTDDGQIFYVMELLRGLPLHKVVERFGPQPPERVVAWLLETCDSLAEAHSFGLIHGDVKPENLFLTREGLHHEVVKVLDFGLAVVRDSLAQAPAATRGEFRAAAPEYLAPEMDSGSAELDGRADLYALGGVAWFLLTGRPVFVRDSVKALREAHQNAEPSPPPANAGAGLGQLLLRLLAKNPDDRPESADALAAELRSLALPRPDGPTIGVEETELVEDFRSRPTLIRTRRK